MKRLQVMLKKETYAKVEALVAKCNEGFDEGHVRTQDVVEWIIQASSADVQKIRARCMNVNKILKNTKIRTRAELKEFVKKIGLVEHLLDDSEAS
jgi:hypothetical protein